MTILNRILLRDGIRRGRLTDYNGQRISFERLLRNGPRAAVSTAVRLGLGKVPSRPWISYDGQARIGRFLDRSKRVLEFGSGMSTRWYAQRAGSVLSLEDNRHWFDRLHDELVAQGNVDHRFCETLAEYLSLDGTSGQAPFDLIVIDGTQRDRCLEVALPHLAAGGMLYLDNSDMHGDGVTGNIPAARARIRAFAVGHGLRVETLTDFAPAQFFVCEATILYG